MIEHERFEPNVRPHERHRPDVHHAATASGFETESPGHDPGV